MQDDDRSSGEISNGSDSKPPFKPPRSDSKPPLKPTRSMTLKSSRKWDRLREPTATAASKKMKRNTTQASVVDVVTSDSRGSGEEPKKRVKQMRHRQRQRKAREIHTEALHNTRDTITLVAMLVATFTYNAGVNPPGGVHQDISNPLIGTAVAARKTAFRVFWVCNNVALFVSICIVLVMVSVIPFRRKALLRIMSMAHRAVWVAVSFMASAYVASQFAIMLPPPRLRGLRWTSVFLLSVCSGSLGAVSVAVGVMWIRHRLVKRKWREQNPRRSRQQSGRNKVEEFFSQLTADAEEPKRGEHMEENDSYDDFTSEDSDVATSRERGYHTY